MQLVEVVVVVVIIVVLVVRGISDTVDKTKLRVEVRKYM